MKRHIIILAVIFILSGAFITGDAFGQDSLFSSCGVLIQGDQCVLFAPEGGGFEAALQFYADFQPGDSVYVSGFILFNCDTICAETDVCIVNNSIGSCDGDPYEPFDGPGILVQTTDCLLFTPIGNPFDYYELDEYGGFGENDTVFVSGTLFQSCQTECSEATGCIIGNTISSPQPPPNYPFEAFGTLYQGLDCILFAPHGDTIAGFELEFLGDFQAGDTVFVRGDLVASCQTSCTGAIACIENNTIDSIWMPVNPIAGSAVIKIMNSNAAVNIAEATGSTIIDSIISEKIYLISFPDSISPDSMMIAFLAFADVIFAEPNFEVDFPENLQLSISFPDEYAPPLDIDIAEPSSFFMQNSVETIGVDSANELSTGSGSVVAVIDNGFDLTHPFLEFVSFIDGYDYFSDDPDPRPDSGLGSSHGTFVTGLIELISPDCQIIPLRALGEGGKGNSFSIAKSIYHAIENGANIINMSFGTYKDSYLLRTACESAHNSGIILVAAGGNDSTSVPIYPASYNGVIAVSAVDSADFLADFSNYGMSMDLCAPGVNIYSALTGDYDWGTWTGSSFSAPLVTAACALMHSIEPGLTPDAAELHLRLSAERDLGPGTIVPPDMYYAYGRLDIADAVWTLNSEIPIDGCGDVNQDLSINVSDAVYIINYVFLPDCPSPPDMNSADVNSDGAVNVSDAIYLVNYIYMGGPQPNCPE
ncbi:MAG: S8 family serine peptidase [candidate division Zixibacteria bacterium]|nr:S8 family serine peptidase [candidate division Zixibacteria bacterium]NIR68148.1 S8 family serine peptidase [candidate division Zixibacteria bacterium]NIS17824.1 S8 family serine peptidase [candidate division Zixibacteria bacterium]NIS49363.1 S8 family serine peptidase [candidate division Zixibacteria bacterium]NIT54142.1 S8 family serine peptidase [candidate division Zixibacteria bacterium]